MLNNHFKKMYRAKSVLSFAEETPRRNEKRFVISTAGRNPAWILRVCSG
jgi:hypothetical protein